MMFSAGCFVGLIVRLISIETFPERMTDWASIVNFRHGDGSLVVPKFPSDTAYILLTAWLLGKRTGKGQMKVKLREEILNFVLVTFQRGIMQA